MHDALESIDRMVHLAAETGTGQSMYEVGRFARTNLEGTAQIFNVLAKSEHHKLDRIVVQSLPRARSMAKDLPMRTGWRGLSAAAFLVGEACGPLRSFLPILQQDLHVRCHAGECATATLVLLRTDKANARTDGFAFWSSIGYSIGRASLPKCFWPRPVAAESLHWYLGHFFQPGAYGPANSRV